MRCQGTVVLGENGRPSRLVGSLRDVTERKQLERTLEHRSTHDFLTGLPNRKHFLDKREGQLLDRPGGPTRLLLHDVKHVQHARVVVERIEKSLADPIPLAGRDVHLRTSRGILKISQTQDQDQDLVPWVESLLELSGLKPTQLQLEITEAALLAKDGIVNQTLDRLGALDIRIDTVAEGVENEAQRDALLALGCIKGQGFLFGAAMPPEQVWSSVARSTLKVSAS